MGGWLSAIRRCCGAGRKSVRPLLALLLLVAPWSVSAQEGTAGPIPEAAIRQLEEELATIETMESTTEIRRAGKKIYRAAEALLGEYPESPDRFRVLGIVFDMQKVMFSMRQSDACRDALLETAGKLVEAPDEHATLRAEPDMMLTQLELAGNGSSPQEHALALARFADRYRGTPAEATTTMMAATCAFDLGHKDLLGAFRQTLSTRFRDDPLVVAFMRDRFGTGTELNLRGEYRRADGRRMSFPIGQTYLVCFWSLDTPLLEEKLAEITAMQLRYSGQFKVFSFNLDELQDYGAGALSRMKLDWTPMRLPGGSDNPTYLSIGGANQFAALVVGPHGLAARGRTGQSAGTLHQTYEAVARFPRQAALLRSLCIGDFLVAQPTLPAGSIIPKETLAAIQACFPSPPRRYRLAPEEELQNYQTAETLCREAIAVQSETKSLWRLHNYRTIALLGLWRLSGDLSYLDKAVAAGRAALGTNPPASGIVIPQFAIATKQIVSGDADAGPALKAFIEAVGGTQAPGSAYAAAMLLSLEAHASAEYLKYRQILLADHMEDVSSWWVSSFLFEASAGYFLFDQALPSGARSVRKVNGIGRPFKVQWERQDGTNTTTTSVTGGALNAVVFTESTTDRNAAALRKQVVDHLIDCAASRPLQDMVVTVVVRSSDPEHVAAMMTQNNWTCQMGCVGEDEWSDIARQLGLVSADRQPNIFIVDPNGAILIALTALTHGVDRPDTVTMRIDQALREHSLALADAALAREDYAEYAARLATSFPLKNRRLSRHEPANLAPVEHGRKLIWAYMQAGDWARALEAASANIALQRGSPDPRHQAEWCPTCHGHLHGMCLRIILLRKMGAKAEADATLARIDIPDCPHGKTEDALWASVELAIADRVSNRRFQSLSDPEKFLAYHEGNLRAGRQNLYGFSVESDLMLRATIHEHLGDAAAAERDRREAAVRAWPYEPREYDPGQSHAATVQRRHAAQQSLAEGEWEHALGLVDRNIGMHEAEALRCNSMCAICSAQVQSFGYYARTLEGLGRTQDAEASRAMAERCKCPPGMDLTSYKAFPVNRMYGGGSGINRLNFIKGIMRGEGYANSRHRGYRLELVSDLVIRSEALEGLGKHDAAAMAMQRATALAYPLGAKAAASVTGDAGPARYEDLVNAAEGQPQ